MTSIDRRRVLAGGMVLVALPALPASYPLPGHLTPEALLEIAADTRRKCARLDPYFVQGIDRSAYLAESLDRFAHILERMATCREPFERLEQEMYATERALQRKHGYTPP